MGGKFAPKNNPEQVERLAESRDMEAVYGRVEKVAAFLMRSSTRTDMRDDIVQETMIQVLQRRRAKNLDDMLNEHSGLLSQITKAQFARHLNGLNRPENIRGRKALRELQNTKEAQLGRELAPSELLDLANEVRLSYPPGRRPTENFHLPVEPISLNTIVDGNTTTIGDLIVDERPLDLYGIDDSEAGDMVQRLQDREISKADARTHLWEALRKTTDDLPPVQSGIRQIDRKSGVSWAESEGTNIHELSRAWLSGEELSPADQHNLFLPFGNQLTLVQQQAVAEKFCEHRDFAKELWVAALRSSNSASRK
ncbi:hypothetical protein [Lysinibacter cavernae]|uniref:hypothetical protein n=1 Tax=Lysinibacter cavernae TaxID=1640652 RepID=UPI0036199F91